MFVIVLSDFLDVLYASCFCLKQELVFSLLYDDIDLLLAVIVLNQSGVKIGETWVCVLKVSQWWLCSLFTLDPGNFFFLIYSIYIRVNIHAWISEEIACDLEDKSWPEVTSTLLMKCIKGLTWHKLVGLCESVLSVEPEETGSQTQNHHGFKLTKRAPSVKLKLLSKL